MVRRHVVDNTVDALAVFRDQPVERRNVTRLDLANDFQIGVSLLPALGGRDERLTENFGRFDHGRNEAYGRTRSKSKLRLVSATPSAAPS